MEMDRRDIRRTHSRAVAEHVVAARKAERILRLESNPRVPAERLALAYHRFEAAHRRAADTTERTQNVSARREVEDAARATTAVEAASHHRAAASIHGRIVAQLPC